MFDELRDIDTAAIEELVEIKGEQETLEERLARMESEKDEVSDAVFGRVRQDYESRGQALEDKARPLKEQARGEYRKLQDLFDRLQQDLEVAGLEKEELEFRHRLGEFEDEAFRERLAICEKQLEERQGELGEVEELKQRFLGAFRSEEELELPPQEEPVEEAPAPDDATRLEPSPPDVGEKGAAPDETEPPPPDVGAHVDAPEEKDEPYGPRPEDETPPGPTDTAPVETLPLPPPPLPGGPFADSEATVLLKGPRLIIHRDEGFEELGLDLDVVTIGRALENTIRFLSTSVSRHHARISMSPGGYVVSDLGSGNGTLVNGEPVTGEHPLQDGDVIQVGSEALVFHDR